MRRFILVSAMTAVAMSCGCPRFRPAAASAGFRYRVFETSVDVIDEAIPPGLRETISDSVYSVSKVNSGQLYVLLAHVAERPGLLAEKMRNISHWPKVADTWSYSRAYSDQDAYLTGSGGGTGYLGVCKKGAKHQIRIEYNVTHSIGTRNPIRSDIFYEGPVPTGRTLFFFAPVERTAGSKVFHVIAFEIVTAD